MIVAIRAIEGTYAGLYGIENVGIFDVDNIEEANSIGDEMACNVVENFGTLDDKVNALIEEEGYDENKAWEEAWLNVELNWTIAKIPNATKEDVDELDRKLAHLGFEDFVKEVGAEVVE